MVIDRLIEQIKQKKNPCIVGIDPEWSKIPDCYKSDMNSKIETELDSRPLLKSERTLKAEKIRQWAMDVIDAVADIVPAVKPQMAFFEVYGADGVKVFEQIVQYAHHKGLLVVDDSKRNDIGNTAKAYAHAHLSESGPINADFLTVSPFLGTDSIQPFLEMAACEGKGLFILVKTSNPSSVEISEAVNVHGEKIRDWLAKSVTEMGIHCRGGYGYSPIGAVVGATFPDEAKDLRKIMKHSFFLVPGYGAQGGGAEDVLTCFNEDGLGAVISSSRGVLYHYQNVADYDGSKEMYLEIVKQQARKMQREVYKELKRNCREMAY